MTDLEICESGCSSLKLKCANVSAHVAPFTFRLQFCRERTTLSELCVVKDVGGKSINHNQI